MFASLSTWVAAEPMAALLAGLTVLILFARTFGAGPATALPPNAWLQQGLNAVSAPLLFCVLLIGVNFLFSTTYTAYDHAFGGLTHETWQHVQATWGDPYTQNALSVRQFHITQELVSTLNPRPNAPPLYVTRPVTHEVADGLEAFTGQVAVLLVDQDKRDRGEPAYNRYRATASLAYEIRNLTSEPTRAEFIFPINGNQLLYEQLAITQDGETVPLDFTKVGVEWATTLASQQHSQVEINYVVRGIQNYFYEMSTPRALQYFALTITTNTDALTILSIPGNDVFQQGVSQNGSTYAYRWNAKQLFLAPRVGIEFNQPTWPYAPYLTTLQILQRAALGGVFLMDVLVLTWLIRGLRVQWLHLILLIGLCAIYSWTLVLLSFWDVDIFSKIGGGTLVLVCGGIALFRRYPVFTQILTYLLMGLFVVGFPLVGWLNPSEQQITTSLVQAGIIFYLFALTLLTRLQTRQLTHY